MMLLVDTPIRHLVKLLALTLLLIPSIFASANAELGGLVQLDKRAADDAQSSLTLDSSQVQTALESTGLNASDPTITASLTSSNNFINWCLTQADVPLTNGAQITGGSCNPTPMGRIVAKDKLPSAKFKYPKNGSLLAANTTFTVEIAVNNFDTGYFSNSETNFLAAPQTVNSNGIVQGHSHITIEAVPSYMSEDPLDPTRFTFFKAINTAASNGILSVAVTNGLPAGVYRISSINTAINHQPIVVGVAQRGSLDDAVYFRVSSGTF